jgi:radical SAM family uncharacterized protein/radical SAM-linked protein
MSSSKNLTEAQQEKVRNFLYYVQRPGRYSDNELNVIPKKRKDSGVHFALGFPDLYEVGMSHLGLKILYTILNYRQDCVVDRVYAPARDFALKLQNHKIPLFSVEHKIPLNKFDLVGFTLQYELSYTNILMMLELGHIPIFSEERDENDPLIIAGGPGAYNPEPLAPFIDAFVIGDGEEIVEQIVDSVAKTRGLSRKERLLHLTELNGIYVPQFYTQKSNENGVYIVPQVENIPGTIKKNVFTDFDNPEKIHFPHLAPLIGIVHNRPSIEIMRGCSRGCRFCQAGIIYRPVRERDSKLVEELVKKEIAYNGWDEISLTSLSTSDYSAIEKIIENITEALSHSCTSISLPSLRMDAFEKPFLEKILHFAGNSLTFAPEAGSQRLRDIINKQLPEENILSIATSAQSMGLKAIKLYFMLGLPGEEDQDVEAIIELIEKIRKQTKYQLKINVSIASFVPKPCTPFQWTAQFPKEELLRKILYIKHYFKKTKRVVIHYHEIEHSVLEAVISRGDRQIAKLICGAYRNGAIFDSWQKSFDYSLWEKSAEENHIDFREYTGERNPANRLCWDHIDCGVSKKFLLDEFQKATSGKITPDCRDSLCTDCGSCNNVTPKYVEKEQITSKPSFKYSGNIQKADEPVFKFRVFYQKVGEMRFFSHRDLLGLIYKIARRSNLPFYFTKGFSPHPKISLGPPLTLGLIGENEFFDINLLCGVPEEYILESLNSGPLPRGFIFKKVESTKDKIALYKYENVRIKSKIAFDWSSGIKRFYNSSSILMRKKNKKINLKEVIKSIEYNKYELFISKEISKANIFDILECLFQFPMDRIHTLEISRENICKTPIVETHRLLNK